MGLDRSAVKEELFILCMSTIPLIFSSMTKSPDTITISVSKLLLSRDPHYVQLDGEVVQARDLAHLLSKASRLEHVERMPTGSIHLAVSGGFPPLILISELWIYSRSLGNKILISFAF